MTILRGIFLEWDDLLSKKLNNKSYKQLIKSREDTVNDLAKLDGVDNRVISIYYKYWSTEKHTHERIAFFKTKLQRLDAKIKMYWST